MQFPVDRFSTPIPHSSSHFLSSSATPSAPWLLLLQPGRKRNLGRFLFSSLHFPIHHLLLPTFIQDLFHTLTLCTSSSEYLACPPPTFPLIPRCTAHSCWLDPSRIPQETSSSSTAHTAPRARCSFEARFARTSSLQEMWRTSKKTPGTSAVSYT